MTESTHRRAHPLNRLGANRRPRSVSSRRVVEVKRLTPVALAGILTCVVLVAVFTATASAKQTRLFVGSFGSAGSSHPDPYPLSAGVFGPSSVAVDNSTGDIYVTDQGNRRIEKFNASGEFILMFGKGVNQTEAEASAPRVQQDVCTAASGDICEAGTQGASPGAFDPPNTINPSAPNAEGSYLFVTVDNSTGPSRGDVYVADSGDDLITKFSPSGGVIESWGDNGPGGSPNGQLNGSGVTAPIKGFYTVFEGIATDASGNLWVADLQPNVEAAGAVAEFRPDSSFINGWATGDKFNGFELWDSRAGIAIDAGEDVYAFPDKYDSAGNIIGHLLNNEREERGIAIDSSSGELYIAQSGSILRFATCEPQEGRHPCSPVELFGSGHLAGTRGLAVDPSAPGDTVYATEQGSGQVAAFLIETVPDVETLGASEFTASSATLDGAINPAGVELKEGLEGCRFEWGETNEPYEHVAPCTESAAQIGTGNSPVPVHAEVSGLQAGLTYHFRLVAGNSNDVNQLLDEPSLGQDLAFGPPLIDSEFAVGVTSNAATLQGQVNPNRVDTRVRIEYGTEAGVYDHSTGELDLGSGVTDLSIPQYIQGLALLTTYHYRVVAENVFGTVEGPDDAFTTQGDGATGLPDSRAWELVSPPEKNGTPLEGLANEGGVIQAAAAGGAFAYIATGAIDAEPAGNRTFAFTQLLAHRGADGWDTQDIATPHEAPAGLRAGHLGEYDLFSEELTLGLVEPEGATPLSPQASERTPYLRESDGEYLPLATSADVPAGIKFGGKETWPEGGFHNGVLAEDATPDLSHVLLQSSLALTTPGFATGGHSNLYEWESGALSLVSQVPTAPATTCGGAGPACSPAAVKGLESNFGLGGQIVRHAVSADGSRVFFEASSQSAGIHLFLRDLVRGETLQLDAPVEGASGIEGSPVFQDASSDGSRVFFTDASRLTANATAVSGKPDLYMCEISETVGHVACTLKDLTVDQNAGESANIQGSIIGVSEDGSSVYFVADGALATGAVHGNCAVTLCNLYLYDTSTDEVKLVAVISSRDQRDWGGGVGGLTNLTARLSPKGRWLAFMSERSLTGYDNRDARSGQPDEEVYLYDAASQAGAGKLVCASCNPTGARPAGVLDDATGRAPYPLADRPETWQRRWLAASVPGWNKIDLGSGLYQSRYLSDSGRLFFNAADALTPRDSNGTEDVYQYEPSGVGGCTGESPSFGEASHGCVGLISSGASGEESAFLDASENGDDVFFLTASRLTSQDVDDALDVYDAHVCSTESSCPAPPAPPLPACEGDACQAPVFVPSDLTPASLTFSGLGNLVPPTASVAPKAKVQVLTRSQKLAKALKACAKKPVRKRAMCKRQAKRKYAPMRNETNSRNGGK